MPLNWKQPRFVAACAIIAGVLTPVVASVAASAAPTPQTTLVYAQKGGQQTTGPFVEYEGANGNDSTQSLSLTSSSCSSATTTVSNPSSAPLLPIAGAYYPTGYTGAGTTASVGSGVTSKGLAETGVCYKASPGDSIVPGTGLDFSIGQSNTLTEGQLFSEASIPLKNNSNKSVTVDFVLRRTENGRETNLETLPFTIPGNAEAGGDSNDCPDTSTGVVATADEFDQLEVQVASPSAGSVSVTGPNCDTDNDADDTAEPTFILVNTTPTFTSAASDTVGANTAFSDTISATGTPTPAFSVASGSTPPTGITLTDNHNGTATLSGTAPSDAGPYTFTLDASNSLGTTPQVFSLDVTTTIAEGAPSSGMVSTVSSSSFTSQLTTASGTSVGAVKYLTTTPSAGLNVSPSGAIKTTAALQAGSYTASGTDSDSFGDSGTWSYTLDVVATTITQATPNSGAVTTGASTGFSAQLELTAGTYVGSVTFSHPSSTPPGLAVSNSGAVSTTKTLAADSYTVTGSDSDSYGDSGTWSYTLVVNATALLQTGDISGSVATAGSATFADQLSASGGIGSVAFSQSSSTPPGIEVAANGDVSTSGILKAGSYTATGSDSDAYGDSGTWTYTLAVNPVMISQTGDTSAAVTTVGSAGFKDQLSSSGGIGSVGFSQSSGTGLSVSATGAVTTAGPLAAGTYTVSGTDEDAYRDSGTWVYTLTVGPTNISQAAPTSNTVASANSAAFTDQLNATAGTYVGPLTFTTSSSSAGLLIASSGAVTTSGQLAGGSYTASGSVTDGYGDSGTWSYDLTVTSPPAITSLDNLIVPVNQPFSFLVTTSGTPAVDNIALGASTNCPGLPANGDMKFMYNAGTGTASIFGTPTTGDAGTYTLCLSATNGIAPDATQVFTLYVTSPSTLLEACGTPNGSCPGSTVTAGIDLNSGTKSFADLTTSSGSGGGSVNFQTEGPLTETYTATLDVGWNDLTYCVPYSGTIVPVCPATTVTIPVSEGGTGVPQAVLACDPNNLPTPPTLGWCSESEVVTYSDTGNGLVTNISEVLYGSGDPRIAKP